MTYICRDKRSI